MIYDVSALCSCSESGELYGVDSVTLNSGELGIMLVSSGTVHCDGVAVSLSAGSLLLYTNYINVQLSANTHILHASLIGMASNAACKSLQNICVSDCGVCPMAAEILNRLLDKDITPLQNSRIAFELLTELASANEKQGALSPLVAEAIDEIHKNYAQFFGIEELSQELGVSKSHLVRVFSSAMGIAPGQYLTRVRIDNAKLLLASRDYPLELIATLCGFSGANYLCKVFKRDTGQTPAAYRKASVNNILPKKALTQLESSLFV